MARQLTLDITEPLALLEELEDRLQGSHLQVRVKILRLLKEAPSRTAAEIAALAESSERTVHRWMAEYRKKGLAGVVDNARTQADNDVPLWQKTLKSRITSGKLSNVAAVREWLEDNIGLRCSRSETQFILRRTIGVQPPWLDKDESEGLRNLNITTDPTTILKCLIALPIDIDTKQWIIMFREAIERLLPGVDRVVTIVRTTCKIMNPDDEKVNSNITYTYYASSNPAYAERTLSIPAQQEDRPADQILRDLKREGRPLNEFHRPFVLDYYFEGKSYLGTMMLFRKATESPLKEPTMNLLDALEPFIIYAMSNHVAWVQRSKTGENPYHQAISMLTREGGLTPQEKRIAIHLMANHPLTAIAHDLNISLETVRTHVRTIHRKTGTRNRGDLLTKYLSPFIVFELPED